MKRFLVVLLAAGAATGAARADTWTLVPATAPAPPAAAQSNGPGLALPGDLSSEPANPEQLTPAQLLPIWQAAGQTYGIPWQVLAAINKVESDFGQNMGPSSAGAVGWMQFMPSTWLEYGTDGNGDGVADPWNAQDAIYSAARYLAASGGQTDLRQAVFAYNHADWYVQEVLQLAATYEAGGAQLPSTLETLHASLDGAQQDVVTAKSDLDAGLAHVQTLMAAQRILLVDAAGADLIGDRLDAAQQMGQLGVEIAAARTEVTRLRARLSTAEEALSGARQNAAGASFAPGAGYLLAAPSVHGGWAFPVGGGPDLVSVSQAHHDYPAADIAAPAGSPVYALADAEVVRAWPDPEGSCGIGVTMRTNDGRVWTYCHLAYLDASVVPGTRLAAGDHVGLVGQTGHATGPHLHLQLQPASAYPQDETWFSSFAGRAFRWQDAPTSDATAAGGPVFAVVPNAAGT